MARVFLEVDLKEDRSDGEGHKQGRAFTIMGHSTALFETFEHIKEYLTEIILTTFSNKIQNLGKQRRLSMVVRRKDSPT
jgi:hypothetical protein